MEEACQLSDKRVSGHRHDRDQIGRRDGVGAAQRISYVACAVRTSLNSFVAVTWPSRAVLQRRVLDRGQHVGVTYAGDLIVNTSTQVLQIDCGGLYLELVDAAHSIQHSTQQFCVASICAITYCLDIIGG